LYLILGDLEGALKSFAWFEAAFPDSMDEAPHVLCWSLALHRAGQEEKARRMLRRTMLANLYILPRLFGPGGAASRHLARQQHSGAKLPELDS